jgi:hypothetical protein
MGFFAVNLFAAFEPVLAVVFESEVFLVATDFELLNFGAAFFEGALFTAFFDLETAFAGAAFLVAAFLGAGFTLDATAFDPAFFAGVDLWAADLPALDLDAIAVSFFFVAI